MAKQHVPSIAQIPRIVPILSGKGGVGKSSVTIQLALALCLSGKNVGILDIDLTGPSIPHMLGTEECKVRQAPGGWLPVIVHEEFDLLAAKIPSLQGHQQNETSSTAIHKRVGAMCSMSLGYLLSSRGDAVIWRGPKKTAMVKQLLTDVLWPSDLDFLLIDTPPGTSDEHISLVTQLLTVSAPSEPANGSTVDDRCVEAIIVTTPQAISTADVRKELSFCAKVGLRVHGLIENMAGYVCPCCGEVTNVFSKGGGQVMAREWCIRFLGSVPLDSGGWGMCVEEGKWPVYGSTGESQTAHALKEEDDDEAAKHDRSSNAPLVERYTACSMSQIFEVIAQQMCTERGDYVRPPAS